MRQSIIIIAQHGFPPAQSPPGYRGRSPGHDRSPQRSIAPGPHLPLPVPRSPSLSIRVCSALSPEMHRVLSIQYRGRLRDAERHRCRGHAGRCLCRLGYAGFATQGPGPHRELGYVIFFSLSHVHMSIVVVLDITTQEKKKRS